MKQFTHVIKDEMGIHARPAGLLVKAATAFKSNVLIKNGEKSADAKRIFGIMGLAAKKQDRIIVTIEGEDENEALLALKNFFVTIL